MEQCHPLSASSPSQPAHGSRSEAYPGYVPPQPRPRYGRAVAPANEFTHLNFLATYPEQSIYSSTDFLKKLSKWYTRQVIQVECFQTDNGFEFTNYFFNSRRDLPTLFETTADQLGIWHKLIRPIPRTTT